MNRRRLLGAGAAGALLLQAKTAFGQTYPAKPIHLIVGYQPGGQSDLIARHVAKNIGRVLGVWVIVENRPGAGGTIGAEYVARAPADGYVLLLSGGNSLTLAPAMDSRVRYDAQRDFVPIVRIARIPLVLVARADLPVASLPELIAHARRNPGELTYASGATIVQVALESLRISDGVEMLHVPYAGSAPAIVDLISGRVDIGLADAAVIAPHVRSGKLRVLAVADTARARAFPEAATGIEQGVPGFVWDTWAGILAPAGTPAAVVGTLQSAIREALAAPDFREGLAKLGFEPIDEDPRAFPDVLSKEAEKFRRLVARIGLRAEN